MKSPNTKRFVKLVFVSLGTLTIAGLPARAEPNTSANIVGQAIGKQFSSQFLNHDADRHDGGRRDDKNNDTHHDDGHHENRQNEVWHQNNGMHQNNDEHQNYGQRFDDHQHEHEAHEQADQWQRAQQQAYQRQAYEHQLHEAREHNGWSSGWSVPWQGGYASRQYYDRPHLSYQFIFQNNAEDWLDDDAYLTLDHWALANFDYYHWGRLDGDQYERSRRYFWQLADLNRDGFISNFEWRFFCNHYARQQYGYR